VQCEIRKIRSAANDVAGHSTNPILAFIHWKLFVLIKPPTAATTANDETLPITIGFNRTKTLHPHKFTANFCANIDKLLRTRFNIEKFSNLTKIAIAAISFAVGIASDEKKFIYAIRLKRSPSSELAKIKFTLAHTNPIRLGFI
jgi:hypothetical protein